MSLKRRISRLEEQKKPEESAACFDSVDEEIAYYQEILDYGGELFDYRPVRLRELPEDQLDKFVRKARLAKDYADSCYMELSPLSLMEKKEVTRCMGSAMRRRETDEAENPERLRRSRRAFLAYNPGPKPGELGKMERIGVKVCIFDDDQ